MPSVTTRIAVTSMSLETGPEDVWVQNCLDLAYLPEDAPAQSVVDAMVKVRQANESELANPSRFVQEGKKLRARLRAQFNIGGDHPKSAAAKPAPGLLAGIGVDGGLYLDEHSALSLRLSFAPLNNYAVLKLLSTFLAAPRLEFRDRIRECGLQTCERIFVRAGPRRAYCSQAHQQDADRLDAAKRVARQRQKPNRK
jgi:hypothetical protein